MRYTNIVNSFWILYYSKCGFIWVWTSKYIYFLRHFRDCIFRWLSLKMIYKELQKGPKWTQIDSINDLRIEIFINTLFLLLQDYEIVRPALFRNCYLFTELANVITLLLFYIQYFIIKAESHSGISRKILFESEIKNICAQYVRAI